MSEAANGRSAVLKRLDRVRNDYVYLSIAIFVSYYDGLLTSDAKAALLYDAPVNALAFVEREAS